MCARLDLTNEQLRRVHRQRRGGGGGERATVAARAAEQLGMYSFIQFILTTNNI